MNQQPIEKKEIREDGLLDVHSIFYTIQGEGPFCGSPAIFIRLAGCNLRCPKCDTDYTSKRELMSPRAILERAQELAQHKHTLVVITGGEPFRQDLTTLMVALTMAGFYVQVESNGTLPPPAIQYSYTASLRHGIYIVCSPKAGKIHPRIAEVACCFKYVMSHDSVAEDGLPIYALDHSASPHVGRPPEDFPGVVYLQPADAKDEKINQLNLDAVIQSCMKNGYTLQLQVHKFINME